MSGSCAVLVMLLLGLGGIAPAQAGELVETGEMEISKSSNDAVAEAAKSLKEGRFDAASTLYAALAEAGGGAEARYWEALARYEGGDLRGARKAIEEVLKLKPESLSAVNLLGLILVDGGSVDEGIRRLTWVRDQALAANDPVSQAKALVNLGLAELDRGNAAAATALLQQAKELADRLGDQRILTAAADTLSAVSSLSGQDAGIGRLLGKGDTKGARAEAERLQQRAQSRRDRVEASILLASVERAEGRLDSSVARLSEAVKEARAAGMVREEAMALGNLGLVQSVAGRHALAADALLAGAARAQSGGYRVVEVDLRCELGIVLARLQKYDEAAAQQKLAGVLLAGMDYPQGAARQAELGGMIAAGRGDLATATGALARATSHYEGLGRPLDAARAATGLAAALEPTAPAEADRWARKAESLFAAAGDSLGPAHVAIARGLADARAKKLPEALAWFGRAAELGRTAGGSRGAYLEAIARENAAQTLVMLGASEDVARLAAEQGLSDLVGRQRDLQQAFDSYDQGLASYNARDWESARQKFLASRSLFEKSGELAYARRAQTSAAWATYNQLLNVPAKDSLARWSALVQEVVKLEDQELYVRSYSASAMAALKAGQTGLETRLSECVRLADSAGLNDVSARCHGALAEGDGELKARAGHARAAFALNPAEAVGIYALYVVAVDAYNAGETGLALELARMGRPQAVELAAELDALIKGAQ